jgi:hypothetical protein
MNRESDTHARTHASSFRAIQKSKSKCGNLSTATSSMKPETKLGREMARLREPTDGETLRDEEDDLSI